MMAGWIQVEQLAVQGMREPGQGMPIRLLRAGQRPGNRVPTETRSHVGIENNIAVVIVVDEGMTTGRVVERERGYDQQEAENHAAFFPRTEQPGGSIYGSSLRRG